MTPQELQQGEILTLSLRLASGASAQHSWTKGDEVRLRFQDRDDVLLAIAGSVVSVEADDDVTARRLRTLRDLDPARIAWLAGQQDRDGATLLTVIVHRFKSRLRWEGELVLAIDERIVERVAKLARRQLDVAEVCAWLTERIVLPQVGDLPRLVATGAPEEGGRTRLLGRGIGVDIVPTDKAVKVERVVSLNKGQGGFRPPETLFEADVRFEDATATGLVRHSVRAQLERLAAESDNTYLALWQKYQEIEASQLARTARELGWLEYTSYEVLATGTWAFQIKSAQQLREFSQRLPEDHQLEAAFKLPSELLDTEATNEEKSERPFVGSVADIRINKGDVLLRPLDEDSAVTPPTKGYLFGALQGDRKRLQRREEAVKRLRSADARIPQLALILEGEPAHLRRTDSVAALSQAAHKMFRVAPTPEQRNAIDRALNTPDIALIQGPPGTGKTTVIAAIQVRLAELEAEESAVGGRTLLTSYQHDAVDNAVERSQVFGLPPARFGGRSGSRAVEDQAERWGKTTSERLQATLAGISEERPRAQYRHFRDRAATYASGQLNADETRAIVDDLRALDPGILPTDVWDALGELGRGLSGGSGDLEQALDERAVRGLPPQNEAFVDGGPARARRALTQLERMLWDDETALLTRASEISDGAPFPEIAELAALRDALLDRLDRQTVPGERTRCDAETVNVLNLAVAALHERMQNSKGGIADALQEYADGIRLAPGDVIETLRHYSAVYAATCQQAVGHAISGARGAKLDLWFENVIVDEAARANPLDLFIPMSLGKRRIILVGDHRQLPHLLEPNIERELTAGADGGSIAEATRHALERSLFERLFEDLQARERSDGVCRVVTLKDQFRMHPVLGAFVSDTFYAPFGEAFRSPRPASEFGHALPDWSKAGRPMCAAWKHIPMDDGMEQRIGTSWSRRVEAEWIARECKRVIDGRADALTIGVITFYRPQVEAILAAMQVHGLAEKHPETKDLDIKNEYRTIERNGKHEERLRVGTVDAFQGMEFDVVILSVVRSNMMRAEDDVGLRRKFGHLLLPNRLCVAMSRQMRLLITVGDQAMFESEQAASAVPGLHRFLQLCGGTDGLVA